jgi:hypothetical protein
MGVKFDVSKGFESKNKIVKNYIYNLLNFPATYRLLTLLQKLLDGKK